MEEDNDSIINEYCDRKSGVLSRNGLSEETKLDEVANLDKVKDTDASNNSAPMYEVSPPTMSDMFNLMTNMQRELEALKRGHGSSNPSSTLIGSKSGPGGPKLTTRHRLIHDMSSTEEDEDPDSDAILSDNYDDCASKLGSKRATSKTNKRKADIQTSSKNKQQKRNEDDYPKVDDSAEVRPQCDDIELKEFAAQYETQKIEPGESVQQWVADLIHTMFTGVNEEKIKKVVDNLKMPANLYLDPPRVNPEIWKNVVAPKQILDFKLQNIMTRQSQAAVLLTQYVDNIFKEMAAVPKEEGEKRQEIKSKALMICDAIALLGQNAQEATMSRRHVIQFAIQNEKLRKRLMKVPLHKNGVPNTFLFGDDLTQPLKDADDDRKMSYKINPKSVLEKSEYARRQKSSYNYNNYKSKNYHPASKTSRYRKPEHQFKYNHKENKENKSLKKQSSEKNKDTPKKKDRF